MKDEYDFSRAKRGAFFRKGVALVPPVRLEPEVLAALSDEATARGVSLDTLVNTLLREDIKRLEAAE